MSDDEVFNESSNPFAGQTYEVEYDNPCPECESAELREKSVLDMEDGQEVKREVEYCHECGYENELSREVQESDEEQDTLDESESEETEETEAQDDDDSDAVKEIQGDVEVSQAGSDDGEEEPFDWGNEPTECPDCGLTMTGQNCDNCGRDKAENRGQETPDNPKSVSGWDFVHDSDYRFLPVFGYSQGGILSEPYKNPAVDEPRLEGKTFTWWEEQSLVEKYPYLLINPVILASHTQEIHADDGGPIAGETLDRDIFRFSKGDQWVFADSGGFQVVSRDGEVVDSEEEHDFEAAKIHLPTLAKWQVQNADAGVTLDVPVYEKTVKEDRRDAGDTKQTFDEWRENVFEPRKNESAEYAKIAQDTWDSMSGHRVDDFARMAVIHGQPNMNWDPSNPESQWDLLREWHKALEAQGEWDGMSLKPRPADDFGQVAFQLAYAAEYLQDYDILHMLQVGSFSVQALLMYYSMLTGQYVTSDSSGYAAGSMFRSYFLPIGRVRDVLVTDRDEEPSGKGAEERAKLDFTEYPCTCEVCSAVERIHGIEYITEPPSDSRKNSTINLHNMKMEWQRRKVIDSLLKSIGPDVVDGLVISQRELSQGKMSAGASNAGYSYYKSAIERKDNMFWKVMADITEPNKLIGLKLGMEFVRDAVEDGITGPYENNKFWVPWYRESRSSGAGQRPALPIRRGGNAMDW